MSDNYSSCRALPAHNNATLQARAPQQRYLHGTLNPLCNAAPPKPKKQSGARANCRRRGCAGLRGRGQRGDGMRSAGKLRAGRHRARLLGTFPLPRSSVRGLGGCDGHRGCSALAGSPLCPSPLSHYSAKIHWKEQDKIMQNHVSAPSAAGYDLSLADCRTGDWSPAAEEKGLRN